MNLEIANRLLQLRRQHQLSQEELAERLGISRQAVSKWERAEASPDTDNLIALARLYHVSIDELLMLSTPASSETGKLPEQPDKTPEEPQKEKAPLVDLDQGIHQNNEKKPGH